MCTGDAGLARASPPVPAPQASLLSPFYVCMDHGTLQALWRYPVKSLRGEACTRLTIDTRGVVHDRSYAIQNREGKFGSTKDTTRFRRIDGLFGLSSRLTDDGISIGFPDGSALRAEDAELISKLSDLLGQAVTLEREALVPHFDDGSIHILSASSLAQLRTRLPKTALDACRFRANLVIETERHIEDAEWVGRILEINDVVLRVTHATERCGMLSMAQGELPAARELTGVIAKEYRLRFGFYAEVLQAGSISAGASVCIQAP